MENLNGSGSDGNSRGNMIPLSPTPGRTTSENDKMDAILSENRYVPPQMRVPLSPIARPESSMSNKTFATQLPMEPFTPSKQGQVARPTASPTTPGTPYRYGPTQLNQQFARLDASLGTPRAPPSVQRSIGTPRAPPSVQRSIGTPRAPSSVQRSVGSGSGSGRRGFSNGGARPGFGGSSNGSTGPTPSRSVNDSSDGGATVASTKGHHLARMIMSGATDDPNGLDFGNPGPSRHPQAVFKKLVARTLYRGRVAAAAGSESNENSPYAAVRNANIRGNPAVYVGTKEHPPPGWLDQLDNGIQPKVEQVFSDLPLIEACRVARPSTAGVIRIHDIPYLTSRAEITAFLGKNAQIINQPIGTPFTAIHIMMDRLSGKTLDAFVEVESDKEANYIANQFARRAQNGRHTRLGDRPVAVRQSSQQEFMQELFPRTKNVTWRGPVPQTNEDLEIFYPGVASTGFIGFFKSEEIAHMIKHVEMPQRSPFSVRCIVRPYECIISTIHKYPWFDVEHVFLSERDALFKVLLAAVDALIELLGKTGGNAPGAARHDSTKPTSMTLKELAIAGLTCPGFSEAQKACIIRQLFAGGYGQYTVTKGLNVTFGGTDVFSAVWPFQILVKKPGVSEDLIEYFAALLRDATVGPELSIADLNQQRAAVIHAHPFGTLDINYEGMKSIADVGRLELRTILRLLNLTLAPDPDNDDPFTS